MAYRRLQNDFFVDDVTGIKYENRPGIGMVAVGDASGAASVTAQSVKALSGGQSELISISGTSAQCTAITTGNAVVTPTVDCFFRCAANPTALSNGTDQLLLGGNSYRISGITSGYELAFITTGAAGTVYITPGG